MTGWKLPAFGVFLGETITIEQARGKLLALVSLALIVG